MKKFSDYTPEEHREISRRGGIASGISRRRKKRLQEFYKIIFTEVLKDVKDNKSDYSFSKIKRELAKIGIKPHR